MVIIDGVGFPGGRHCETTALGALLRHAGVELSEPMLFGLGEGLGFVYWDAKNMAFPFLGGRTKPATITRTVADRLGLTLHVQETASTAKAWRTVAAALDAGRPVGLQLDSYHLEYFTAKVHFGGHFVAMYGYDDTHAYLIDTAQQGGAVTTTLASLERARHERGPMTARNLSYTITAPATWAGPATNTAPATQPGPATNAATPPGPEDANQGRPALEDAIRAAIRANAHAFLNPPIANLGHRGIAKAAGQVTRWLDRAADPAHDLPLAATLMERAGTGGSLFRAMYRDFLAECTTIVDDDNLRLGHRLYTKIAPLWTEVADQVTAAGETCDPDHLTRASAILTELAGREREAMRVLSGC